MQVEIFTGNVPEKLQEEINKWLSSNNLIITHILQSESSAGERAIRVVTISIFYQ